MYKDLKKILRLPENYYSVSLRYFFGIDPLKVLFVFIFMMPLAQHELIDMRILPLPGAKPYPIYSVYLILVLMYNSDLARKIPDYAANYFKVLILLYIISFARSIEYLNYFRVTTRDPELTVERYALSYLVRPLTYLIPFVAVIQYVRNVHHLKKILDLLMYVLLFLSVFLIIRFTVYMPVQLRSTTVLARAFLAEPFKIHGNDLGNFYTILLPIVMAQIFVKRTVLSIATFALSIVSIAILYSRTVYIVTLITILMYSVITKRFVYIALILIVIIGLVPFVAPNYGSSTVIRRISRGIEGEQIDTYELSAGRTEDLWIPLVTELIGDKKKLLIGIGMFGITGSEANKSGLVPLVTHPHNMYLEIILNTGLIGFLLLVFSMGKIIKRGFKSLKSIRNPVMKEYQASLLVSATVYLVAGMTSNTFFPKANLSFIWVVFGSLVAVDGILNQQTTKKSALYGEIIK